jgi:hypothetical protein
MARVLMATQPWGVIQRRDVNGVVSASAAKTVHMANTDGSAATTWTAETGGSSTTADTVTDSNGAMPNWIEEGVYDQTIDAVTKRVQAVRGQPLSRFRDGLTDATAAIQSAITNGIADRIPAGTYMVSSAINLTLSYQKMLGVGSGAVVLKPTAAHPGPVVQINGATNLDAVGVGGFTIDMSNVNLIVGVLVTGSGTARSYISDLVVTGATGGWPSIGLDLQNFGGKISDVTVANPTTAGVRANGDNSMPGLLVDCTVTMTDAAVTCADGLLISRTTGPDNGGTYLRRFRVNRSAGTINNGIRFVSTNAGGTNAFITMTDCVSDNVNGGPSLRIDKMHNIRTVNGYYTRSVNSAIACELSACNDVTLVSNWLPNVDLQLAPNRILFVANEMTQGGAAQVFKVDAANAPGDVYLAGNRVPAPATTPLTNDHGVLAKSTATTTSQLGFEALSARSSGATRTFAIRDASGTAIGKAKFFQVDGNGHLLIVNDAFTTVEHTLQDNGVYQSESHVRTKIVAATYGTTVTPNLNSGNWQTITVTNATAFTVAAPTNPPDSTHTTELIIEVFNNSGGAMGAITWNAALVLVGGAFTNPATTKRRYIKFGWNGTNWIETARAGADY